MRILFCGPTVKALQAHLQWAVKWGSANIRTISGSSAYLVTRFRSRINYKPIFVLAGDKCLLKGFATIRCILN